MKLLQEVDDAYTAFVIPSAESFVYPSCDTFSFFSNVLVFTRESSDMAHIHAVRHTAAPAKRDQSFGQKIRDLLMRKALEFDRHSDIVTGCKTWKRRRAGVRRFLVDSEFDV